MCALNWQNFKDKELIEAGRGCAELSRPPGLCPSSSARELPDAARKAQTHVLTSQSISIVFDSSQMILVTEGSHLMVFLFKKDFARGLVEENILFLFAYSAPLYKSDKAKHRLETDKSRLR